MLAAFCSAQFVLGVPTGTKVRPWTLPPPETRITLFDLVCSYVTKLFARLGRVCFDRSDRSTSLTSQEFEHHRGVFVRRDRKAGRKVRQEEKTRERERGTMGRDGMCDGTKGAERLRNRTGLNLTGIGLIARLVFLQMQNSCPFHDAIS